MVWSINMKTLILDTTNKSLVATLGEAHTTASVTFTVHDGLVTSSGMTEENTITASNGVSEVTLCSAPSSGQRKLIRNITVYNSDTVTHSFYIKVKDTATLYGVIKVTLLAGESWSSGNVLVLGATDESLRTYLGEAITTNQVNYTCHYADVTSSTMTEGNSVANSNGVTYTEILAAPASSTRRVVRDIVVYNADTVSHIVYLSIRKASTDYLFKKVTIAAGDYWTLTQGDTYEVDHKNLRNIGTNTHGTIDTFIASKAAASGLASLNGSTLVVENPANATATPTASKISIADGSGKLDGWITVATTSAAGISELATSGEVTTGTDTGRTIPPAGLAKSNVYGVKAGCFRVVAETVDVDTTSGVYYFWIPQALNGLSLLRANAMVDTAGTTNATTIQVRNLTKYGSNDALSSAISIASGGTVGTAGTVATSYDDVSTNDKIKVYVTGQSTTKPKGLSVVLEYQLY
jgi:hypothetical protein